MNLSLIKPNQLRRPGTVGDAPPDLVRKADICFKILVEARRLFQSGQYGTVPNQLAVRAGELLDDVDEILVALEPTKNASSFAIAATLHRELEHIQATITNLRRGLDRAGDAANKC